MYLTFDAHAQAVRDRQQALRRDAYEHRLAAPTARAPRPGRLRCLARRLGFAFVQADGCGRRMSPAGSR